MDPQIDTRWFQNQLADKRLSQRQLAKRMDLDPAAVSLMLRGKRKMTANEAVEIANMLGVSADEVLMRAGSAPTLPAARSAAPAPQDVPMIVGSFPNAVGYGFGRSHELKAKDVATSAPQVGQPDMIELPVPMSDGSTAKLLLPRVLARGDADRISALVQALAL